MVIMKHMQKPCKVYNKLGLQHHYPLIIFIETIAVKVTLQSEHLQSWGVIGEGATKAEARMLKLALFP